MSSLSLPQDPVAIELGLVPAPPGYKPVRYRRNKRGTVVHRRDCHRQGESRPWFWAQRFKDDDQLCDNLPGWVTPCRDCFWLWWRQVERFRRGPRGT